ncbi:hypothetical protein DFH07DRAFT_968182 [Mycena maculata]|uniref:Plus3 domain-containing protein n=1 Tax=Mycena maculata TaxID=230809 RepID=A0AAD7I2C0_9AGAR|nr:hypothetical protein DFH07DRAFT_968182 [Mycena maculata]
MASDLDDEIVNSDKTRKRRKDGSAPGNSKSTSSKKRKLTTNSNNEPESGDCNESVELYPLEGLYVNEEDRERLLQKTEVERERILTERLDEIAEILDRKHVAKLRAEQLKQTEYRTLNDKRKTKEEKQTRGSSPEYSSQRSSSPANTEISDSGFSQVDEEGERIFGLPKPPPGTLPLTTEYLLKIALTRDALAKYSMSPHFEKIVICAWVRYLIGKEEGKPIYRICQIRGFSVALEPYSFAGRMTRQAFELKHGNSEKAWPMDGTSNTRWTEYEFKRLVETHAAQGVPMFTRKDVDKRLAEMQELIARPVTESDITGFFTRRSKFAVSAKMGALERSRKTWTESNALAAKPIQRHEARASREELLARVSERNRQENLENVHRAEERKRREWKNGGGEGGAPAVTEPDACSLPCPAPKSNERLEAVIDSIEVDLADF